MCRGGWRYNCRMKKLIAGIDFSDDSSVVARQLIGVTVLLDGVGGRIVETDHGPALMAFHYWQTDGTFAGTVCDPMPLGVDPDTGALSLRPSP